MGCGVKTADSVTVADGAGDADFVYSKFVRSSWDVCPLCKTPVSKGLMIESRAEQVLSPESPMPCRRMWWRSRYSTSAPEMGALEYLPPPEAPETLLRMQRQIDTAHDTGGGEEDEARGPRYPRGASLATISGVTEDPSEAEAMGLSTWRLKMLAAVEAALNGSTSFPRRHGPLIRQGRGTIGAIAHKDTSRAPAPDPGPDAPNDDANASPGSSPRPRGAHQARDAAGQHTSPMPSLGKIRKKDRLKVEVVAAGDPCSCASTPSCTA